jgi:hypothetical protein
MTIYTRLTPPMERDARFRTGTMGRRPDLDAPENYLHDFRRGHPHHASLL